MSNSSLKNCLSKLIILLLGAILTLAYAPFNMLIAAPISLSGLLYYLEKEHLKKRQFILGILYGIGFFASSLYWLAAPLLVDIKQFWWIIPFALLGVPVLISLFIGGLCVATSFFRESKIIMALAFSALWGVGELLRSYALLPFPWQILGYISDASIYIMQFLSVLGVHGMSLVLCVISTSFYTRNRLYIASNLLVLGLIWGYGYYRVNYMQMEVVESGYTIRIVQPNLIEHHMGDKEKQYHAMLTLMELSIANINSKENYILLWPEAAFPFGYYNDSPWHKVLTDLIPKGSVLVTGLDRLSFAKESQINSHNSIMSFADDGKIIGYYDKVILVPFGEYIPLRKYLPQAIAKVVYGIGDFIPGKKGKVLQINEIVTFLPLICYEAIFPYFIGSIKLEKIDVFLNITNDAWIGDTIGPYQHAAMARARAVEFGKPLVRVANNGISFIVDPKGKLLNFIPLNHEGVLDIPLYYYNTDLTFYYRYQTLSLILIIVLLFYCFMMKKKIKKK